MWRSFTTTVVRQCAQPPKKPQKKIFGPITWKSMAAVALVGGGLTGFVVYVRKEKQESLDRERKRQLGKAKIGGSFELVDPEVTFLSLVQPSRLELSCSTILS